MMNKAIQQAAKQILETVISNVAATGSVKLAWEKTFGEGSYDQMAEALYNEFRSQQ